LSSGNPAGRGHVAKILVLYSSACDRFETIVGAVVSGAHGTGAIVDIKRVRETAPEEIGRGARLESNQTAPIATVADLENYDAIIVGTDSRSGLVPSRIAAFLDQAGMRWARDAIARRFGSGFAFTGGWNADHEAILASINTNLLQSGMRVVDLPCRVSTSIEFASAPPAMIH
jgi:NAD(P)H dehydrogenase (quinone)